MNGYDEIQNVYDNQFNTHFLCNCHEFCKYRVPWKIYCEASHSFFDAASGARPYHPLQFNVECVGLVHALFDIKIFVDQIPGKW